MQLGSLIELKEVQPHKVIKVRSEDAIVGKVHPIIKFGELQYHLNDLGLACTGQAAVVLSPKNSLDALVYHLGADWI